MSEYQYYEFQAIDRPLTAKEMSDLRAYSTRARITPTSFVNEYSWGSFKGNEDAWMEKYFDAFLYLANWGTHVLKLRLPSRLLDSAIARVYCGGGSASVREESGEVILSFVSEDQTGSDWVEGEGQLSSLMSVRAELAHGDLRALYLGWLLRAQEGDLDDLEVEPPVPPGLGQLSASLESLADFLRLDSDLVRVAAAASALIGSPGINRDEVRAWVGTLPTEEKEELLTSLVVEADQAQALELRQRFLNQSAGNDGHPAATARTVRHLLEAAEAHATERIRIEAEKRAEAKARHDREAAVAREKYLDRLAGREASLWAEIDGLVATKQPKSYDRAVLLLADLRDLQTRGTGGDFQRRAESLRQAHVRKPAFIERLRKAGI